MEQTAVDAGTANLDHLSSMADTMVKFELTASILLRAGHTVTFRWTRKDVQGHKNYFAEVLGKEYFFRQTLSAAIIDIVEFAEINQTVTLKALSLKIPKGAANPSELRSVAIRAFCEALKIVPPLEAEVEKSVETVKSMKDKVRQELIDNLKGGVEGHKLWSQRTPTQMLMVKHLKKSDLSQANLEDVDFYHDNLRIFDESNFTDANLTDACLDRCDFVACNFHNAVLSGAHAHHVDFSDSDFSGASLTGADCRTSKFQRVNFQNADLTDAVLFFADLRGAQLSEAKLDGAQFRCTLYDEHTQFPPGFAESVSEEFLHYERKGKDPLLAHRVKALAPKGEVDFDTFVKKLNSDFDRERMKKAMKMLQAESFQLFAEVKPDSLVGVVKSQTNPDLVYSCVITETGHFACCTQNLMSCGGLRGSLCKHLLVLLIGITKSGDLEAKTACTWVMASKRMQPKLDREIMTNTFLRHKGAESGEIDWRPTETIPEDYYAY